MRQSSAGARGAHGTPTVTEILAGLNGVTTVAIRRDEWPELTSEPAVISQARTVPLLLYVTKCPRFRPS